MEWHPWGEAALQLAKDLDKPILVSIGYAACHWCHVMERESFEDAATAKIMNDHFVNIKIDREERPDLDHIYMDVVQAMTGSGGWPLNVFLTPDKKPFYGGTYFPNLKWKQLLANIAEDRSTRRRAQSQAEAGARPDTPEGALKRLAIERHGGNAQARGKTGAAAHGRADVRSGRGCRAL